jgi:hypothetical protein
LGFFITKSSIPTTNLQKRGHFYERSRIFCTLASGRQFFRRHTRHVRRTDRGTGSRRDGPLDENGFPVGLPDEIAEYMKQHGEPPTVPKIIIKKNEP